MDTKLFKELIREELVKIQIENRVLQEQPENTNIGRRKPNLSGEKSLKKEPSIPIDVQEPESDVFAPMKDEPSQPPQKQQMSDDFKKGARKMLNILHFNVAQMSEFQKANDLTGLFTKRIRAQTGLNVQNMAPVVKAVIQATLKALEDEVGTEINQKYPELWSKVDE